MHRSWASAALGAALGLMLLQALPAHAATPTDLGAILALPPTSDYLEPLPASSVYLEGSFDAHKFARWVTQINGHDTSGYESQLNSYKFTRGFARTWWLPRTDHLLEEFVFEFEANDGALSWVGHQGEGASAMTEYRGPLTGGTALPFAWTARVSIDGPNGADRVGFSSGNDVYEISFESHVDDLTALALQQGQAQYKRAPANTVPPERATSSSPPASSQSILTAIRWIGLGVAAVIALMTGLALLLIARRS